MPPVGVFSSIHLQSPSAGGKPQEMPLVGYGLWKVAPENVSHNRKSLSRADSLLGR